MLQPFAVASDEDFDRLMENPLFRRFLDTLSIGVSVTDPTGTIRYFSRPCYRIYGLDPSESVVGRKIDAVFRTGERGVLDSLKNRTINTLNSIMFNGIEGICRRYPILDDAGNLLCCLSEVITTTYEKKRIDELLLDIQRLKQKVGYIVSEENPGRSLCSFDDLVGESAVMQSLKVMGRRFARSREPVLILGESGTGKELFAQAVHLASPRAEGAFVSVNCAALPRELAESELFGYVEGAFTGAKRGGKRAARRGNSSWRTKARFFWTKSGNCPFTFRPSSCACWKAAKSRSWARRAAGVRTSGSSPPPTATCPIWWPRAPSAKTSTTA